MEDWLPDESEIDVLFNMNNQSVTGLRGRVNKETQEGLTREETAQNETIQVKIQENLTDEESSDGEENLELELERHLNSQHQDPDILKRLRHRLISRRSRHKKKRELDELAGKVYALERQYKTLQLNTWMNSKKSIHHVPLRYKYFKVLQHADQLRAENETLLHAIDKHENFNASLQSTIPASSTLYEIQSMSICDFIHHQPLTATEFQFQLDMIQRDSLAFQMRAAVPTETIHGWIDQREIDSTHRIHFQSTKSIPGSKSIPNVIDKTWALLTDPNESSKLFPYLRKLQVLETFTKPKSVILRRDFQFNPSTRSRIHYTTLLLVHRQTSAGGHVISCKTIDTPITENPLGENETWTNEFIEFHAKPNSTSWTFQIRGWQQHSLLKYSNVAIFNTLQVLLKWETFIGF